MPGPSSPFLPPYRELHVRDVGDLDGALIGYGLRREFEQQVRTRLPELMMKGIARCWTRWSQVWVVQCGGDCRNNRVVLAGRQPHTTVELTLPYLQRYQVRTPLSDTSRLLTLLEADYSPGTPTRALVDALTQVLDLCRMLFELRATLEALETGTAERFLTIAPATANDKTGPAFPSAWAAADQLMQL